MGWLPSWPDIVSRQLDRNDSGYPQVNPSYSQAGAATADRLKGLSGAPMSQGFANLLQILQSHGRTDPTAMNNTLGGIQRDTQANQNAQAGKAAGTGFQNSGVNQAINAAIGQAGVGKQADVRANEAQMAEQRKRGDLQLLIDLVLNPSLGFAGIGEQGREADQRTRMQREAAMYALMGEISKSIGQATGGIGGGGAAAPK